MHKYAFEVLLSFLREWRTKKGYFAICLLILLPFQWFLNQGFTLQTTIIFTLLGLISWLILWLIASGRMIIPNLSKKIVVLCISVETGGVKNYNRVIKNLKLFFETLHLEKQIKLISIADDIIKNKKDAHRYRESNHIDLIIWGEGSYGNLKSEKVLKFDLFHTMAISDSLKQKLNQFLADVTLILQKKDWLIRELNELEEFKSISENIFETILFVIGLYLYDEKKFYDSIFIFETILPKIEEKEKNNNFVEHHLQAARIRFILNELYYLQGMQYHEEGKIEEALTTFKKIPEHIPNKIPLYIMLARIYYLNGDISNAEVYTEKIRKINRKHPAVCLNYAFLGMRVKNYDRVLFWYNMFLKNEILIDIDIYSVIDFLVTEYDKNQSELAFLYALGIVNGYIDLKKRKSDFRKFISKAKNRPEYKLLIQRAQELLNDN